MVDIYFGNLEAYIKKQPIQLKNNFYLINYLENLNINCW